MEVEMRKRRSLLGKKRKKVGVRNKHLVKVKAHWAQEEIRMEGMLREMEETVLNLERLSEFNATHARLIGCWRTKDSGFISLFDAG